MSTSDCARDDLVRQLLGGTFGAPARERFPRVPDGRRVPLTPAQAGIWFLTQLFPDSTEYNMFPQVELDHTPDEQSLQAALSTLVARHDVLRVRFVEVDGQPVMEDAGAVDPPVTWYDLRHLPAEDVEQQIQEIGNASARVLMRPDQPPLIRCCAVRKPGGRALLIVLAHHLVCDGWSWSILHDELVELLAGRELPPPQDVRFLDYAAWCAERDDESLTARDYDYWTQKLGGELPVLDLPKDRPRPAVSSRRGHARALELCPAEVTDRLRELARAEQTTLFVVLLAVYQMFLRRLTRQSDLVIGTFLAGRDHPETEKLVGCFAKSVALRTDLDGVVSFRDAVRRARQTVAEALDHQAVSFEQVVARLRIPRDLSTHPVFQTSFAASPADRSWEASALFLGYGTAKWDMGMLLTDSARGLDGAFDCSADLLDRSSLERYGAVFARLVTSVAQRPDDPLDQHAVLAPDEQRRIVYAINRYERPEPGYRTLAQPFEEQVGRTPAAVAVVAGDDHVTYAELNARANRLAHAVRAAGGGPGRRVAVCLERGVDAVTAVYAAAKSGAAYVPLEPELPDARLAFMLGDTAPQVVLTDAATGARIPDGPWRVVDVADPSWASLPEDDLPPDPSASGQAVGYLLYTSGSTGRPKAVAYPIDAAIASLQWIQHCYPYGPGDAAVFKTSYGFDVSIWELFWPLYYGARLVVCRPGGHRDPGYLADVIERHAATTLYLAPAMLQVFLDELDPGRCPSLRTVVTGGEVVTPRLRDSFFATMDAELVNGYGPTEAGTVTYQTLGRWRGRPAVPLGRPAPNFRFYVLDESQQVVPVGVAGEAYIGGEIGLAHGYHRRPALTAERFVPDPFGPPGARMYRTGDVCRYRSDELLEHLGRIDHQVKIRGMRVELSEIEAVLCEHPAVADAVVLKVDEAGGSLVAWVVATPGEVPDTDHLVERARRFLPAHMVPRAVVPIPEIPTTVNGKVDRRALLETRPQGDVPATARAKAPASPREEELAAAFAEVLDVERVGVTDSFFDLGGHSLLVFRLIGACERRLGVRPSVSDVFGAPTVRALGERLARGPDVTPSHPNLVALRPAPARPTVAFVHGSGGSAIPFYELARHLEPEYSTYALQSTPPSGPGGTGVGGPSIEDLAARYAAALDTVRGLSPLVLVGWSMGGCIALEMAELWDRQGTPPAAVVLLDTWAPSAVLPAEVRAQAREALIGLEQHALRDAERGLGAEDPELEALRQRSAVNRAALLRYQPGRSDRAVTLLHPRVPATDGLSGCPDVYRRPDRGWGGWLAGLRTVPVDGDHFSMVGEANAQALCDAIHAAASAELEFTEI